MPIKWIAEIPWKKVIKAGVIFTVVSMIIRQIETFLTMRYYIMPQYFGVWSKLMMPKAGPPPPEFMLTSIVFTLVTGISLAIVYCYLRSHLPKDAKKRVFYFADLMVGTSFIFFTLPVYLLFNVALGLIISWFISSFVILIAASYIFVKTID